MAANADDAVMRVLGIDPGLRRTGYGCIECSGVTATPRVVEAGVIRLDPRTSVAERLAELSRDLRSLVAELRPDRLAVEQVFSHAEHVRTAILMAHARGVVLLCGAEASLPLDELAPAEVKRAIAGSGRAAKEQMQEAVRIRCGLRQRPEPHDVADALAIALCGADRSWSERLSADATPPVATATDLSPRPAPAGS
ncbi:MAG: crossover junction endodeoxyribonuclease RuvC [Planctomycetota bacterium]|jgi:crossover junction endodeoxyribonuclease RuvC